MLQFITHHTDRYDEIQGTEAVLRGGCRWVQLRMKDASPEEFLRVGREVGCLCRQYGATFLLDDRVDAVKELGADGVHLGKNDMPVAEARKLLGPDKLIGATANTFEDIARAAADGADYIGLGPFRFTQTKRNLSPILGLEGYRTILARCREAGIDRPVVAIGGITAADIADLMATGISGVALSGTLLGAEQPAEETRKIMELLTPYRQ
ncbi:thiamine phosphate synthase [uncultured Alistipes sp.]|uniref:thiamine phosphate synthase n=1 Tax=uncultured Alistipes sp. TaxID=538949 RepID=UPI002633A424|nr:thiamine phosphate synthase [uncultured Alistipes sp.]